GRTIMNNNRISFHTYTHSDGRVDLYVKPITDYDCSFYLTDYMLFNGSSENSLWYESVNGLEEIEKNITHYKGVNPVVKITSGKQDIGQNNRYLIMINNRVVDQMCAYRSSEPGRITYVIPGIYEITGTIVDVWNPEGYRHLYFAKNCQIGDAEVS